MESTPRTNSLDNLLMPATTSPHPRRTETVWRLGDADRCEGLMEGSRDSQGDGEGIEVEEREDQLDEVRRGLDGDVEEAPRDVDDVLGVDLVPGTVGIPPPSPFGRDRGRLGEEHFDARLWSRYPVPMGGFGHPLLVAGTTTGDTQRRPGTSRMSEPASPIPTVAVTTLPAFLLGRCRTRTRHAGPMPSEEGVVKAQVHR